MFAGRKLLVVDDSPYYRTVIGLTFADEGMEVMTAESAQEALGRLEQYAPDVILANISLSGIGPGINGYELCGRIKQNERFGHIPVMLLVGLHELFDQAEARRVGADDVVTKPFKSIRQLVDRVGSLLGGGTRPDTDEAGYEHSTLGLGRSDASPAPAAAEKNMTETNVFIEAPAMTEHEPFEPVDEPGGSMCVANIELQTANTQKLEVPHPVQTAAPDGQDQTMDDLSTNVFIEASPIAEHEPLADRMSAIHLETPFEPAGSTCAADVALQTADTQELQPIDDEPAAETMEQISYAKNEPTPEFNEQLLDLDDFDAPAQVAAEDLILDLDYDYPASESAVTAPETVYEPVPAFAAPAPAASIATEPASAASTHEEEHLADLNEWAIVTEVPQESAPLSVVPEQESSDAGITLSLADIETIARRVVEQLSDKAVREIAWEVVPELAELLIKQKLEEQK